MSATNQQSNKRVVAFDLSLLVEQVDEKIVPLNGTAYAPFTTQQIRQFDYRPHARKLLEHLLNAGYEIVVYAGYSSSRFFDGIKNDAYRFGQNIYPDGPLSHLTNYRNDDFHHIYAVQLNNKDRPYSTATMADAGLSPTHVPVFLRTTDSQTSLVEKIICRNEKDESVVFFVDPNATLAGLIEEKKSWDGCEDSEVPTLNKVQLIKVDTATENAAPLTYRSSASSTVRNGMTSLTVEEEEFCAASISDLSNIPRVMEAIALCEERNAKQQALSEELSAMQQAAFSETFSLLFRQEAPQAPSKTGRVLQWITKILGCSSSQKRELDRVTRSAAEDALQDIEELPPMRFDEEAMDADEKGKTDARTPSFNPVETVRIIENASAALDEATRDTLAIEEAVKQAPTLQDRSTTLASPGNEGVSIHR